MKKKLLSFTVTMAIVGGFNTAQSQDKLSIYPVNSNVSVWETELSKLRMMTFSDEGLAFVDHQDQTVYTPFYQEIGKITFSLTGVVGIEDDTIVPNHALALTATEEYLKLSGWDMNEKADVSIYSINGQLCSLIKEWCGTPIPVLSLPQGFYLLKVNNQTFKFGKL